MKNCDFLLGAGNGVVDEVEFDLQLFALLDLCAIGCEQGLRFRDLLIGGGADLICHGVAARRSHLRADRAEFGHDFAMHRHWLAAYNFIGHRCGTENFFNAKSLATNRHQVPQRSINPPFVYA